MASRADTFVSIKLTRFYMKVIGFWPAANKREQYIYAVTLIYTIAAVIFAIAVEGVDLYHCWGDFDALTHNFCITTPLVVIIIKTTLCLIRRDAVLELISFATENFWNATYDEFGDDILTECNKRGILLVCTLSFAVQGTVSTYVIKPMFVNVGKNETDRVLPFKLWVDLPVTTTPFYEIIFTIQTLSTIHSAICFFCFDNLMGILNIHIVGQFKILQQRITNLCEDYINSMNVDEQFAANLEACSKDYETIYSDSLPDTKQYKLETQFFDLDVKTFGELKKCIKQHQVLIDYVDKLEYAFNLLLLCQFAVSSILMCLGGFKVFVDKEGIYTLHLTSVVVQILLYTWTGNEIIVNSVEIAAAAYRCRWYMMPYSKAGRSIRDALTLMAMRSQRACFVSAGHFTAVSLEAFTSILGTTSSYLSVMRQMSETLK